MYYMLNLMFNYLDDSSAPNGRFVDYISTETDPMKTSKAWLQSTDGITWTFFERDKTHLTFPLNTQPTLSVRVADFNQASDNYSAQITVLMSRNDPGRAQQPMSSPIQSTNGVTGPLCVWNSALGPANGNSLCWLMPLGQATLGTGGAGDHNKYLFLVAATVNGVVQGQQVTRTFCHDPDLDVSC
jgi:hypothetical protein